MMDPLFICFSKRDVVSGNYRPFLKVWGKDKLPRGKKLRRMMGTCSFFVDGYNDKPEEIYAIPEIRAFYAGLHDIWPYWFYFCDLRTESLHMVTSCLLGNVSARQVLGEPKTLLHLDPMELVQFVGRGFDPMNEMCERARMSEFDIFKRTGEIFQYYRLPIDAGQSPPN